MVTASCVFCDAGRMIYQNLIFSKEPFFGYAQKSGPGPDFLLFR